MTDSPSTATSAAAAGPIARSTAFSFLGQAMLASSCCLLQLALNLFSLGCAGVVSTLQPFRGLFLAVLVASMAWRVYREQRKPHHARHWGRLLALFAVCTLIAASPDLLEMRNDSVASQATTPSFIHPQSAAAPNGGELTLLIGGMHCEACRHAVQSALTEVAGVTSVHAHLDTGRTQIEFSEHAAPADKAELQARLIRAVEDAGFSALKATPSPHAHPQEHGEL